jgi:hypothetical protein
VTFIFNGSAPMILSCSALKRRDRTADGAETQPAFQSCLLVSDFFDLGWCVDFV